MAGELPEAAALEQGDFGLPEERGQDVVAELILDSHRVVGEVQHVGALRRLVDIMNAIDGTFIVVNRGEVDDLHRRGEAPRRFAVVHVHRNAILFALPRAVAAHTARTFEMVEKVPVPATIVLPGFEISGNVYLPPDVDPARAPLLATSRFVPLTEATVVAVQDGGRTWQEPVVVVNLGRALLWAPRAAPEA